MPSRVLTLSIGPMSNPDHDHDHNGVLHQSGLKDGQHIPKRPGQTKVPLFITRVQKSRLPTVCILPSHILRKTAHARRQLINAVVMQMSSVHVVVRQPPQKYAPHVCIEYSSFC